MKLGDILEKVNLPRDAIFIANILKCRPPKNRNPRVAEVKACTPHLDRQLELIRPRFLVTLGRHSTAYVFSKMGLKPKGITELRGQIHEADLWGSKIYVLPTFHPAATLYNVQLKDDLERDFELLKSELERQEELG